MYVIVVYDVSVDRVIKVNKFLYQHLYWRQNSVFEGELRKSQLMEITYWFKDNLDENDRVIIYTFKSKRLLRRIELGESQPMTRIL
ncbi:MAG TPA: CRISPR-associated endonuclease Cas2 [Candidatus Altiarchaeales archaeon]|nr:CRISPR-associated endonuclease Cas2 [Candidatus Altiarchaeales archaeon]